MLPEPASLQALEMHRIWVTFFWCGAAVYVLVAGLIVFAALRYRRRDGSPATFHENPPLEIAWTVVPLAVVLTLFGITYAAESHVEHVDATPANEVVVTGFRWSWRFDYPRTGISVVGTPFAPPDLVLPAGETTRVTLLSADVVHAFWVPRFLFQRDATPGYRTSFDVTPNAPGTFPGACAEFCGLQHAEMRFRVRVVDRAAYAAWIAERRR